tara:strand:+ start:333 stop:854 length:522 start_codon:yes stop_codon:yes gene_type:complete
MTIKQTAWTISSTDSKQHGKKENQYTFSCNSIYLIKEKDLIDLLITAGQGINYWGVVYVNFIPNKAYEKGYVDLEHEGGIFINKNNLSLESKLFCLDYQCYEIEDKSEIEIIEDKTIKDFINTIKLIIENPNTRGDLKTRIIEALASADYGILDASDLDYIMQKCIFGSCVYG